MKHFGSIEKIKNASVEELAEIEGMNIRVAQDLYNHFRRKEEN
jgi:excinuclease ABC subunit C